jgi:hypothetical protein
VIRAAIAVAVLVAASGSAGCGKTEEAKPAPSKPAPPPGTLALGERITSPLVPLAAIAKDPASYRNRVIATSGKVTSVCQEMGCWLELQDDSGQAHVRMHGHSFFVPRTSPGHIARIQATVIDAPASAGAPAACHHPGHTPDDDCEAAQQGASAGSSVAKIQLDATGVEID